MRLTETHLADLESRSDLPRRSSPYWLPLRRGVALGYRQGVVQGTWLVKAIEAGHPPLRQQERLGLADDGIKADGSGVLSFETARRMALAWRPRPDAMEPTFGETFARPATVEDAVMAHLAWLEAQGKPAQKAHSMAKCHIYGQPIAMVRLQDLTYSHLEAWRNKLGGSRKMNLRRGPGEGTRLPLDGTAETKEQTRARHCTANRVLAFFKAALNGAETVGRSSHDPLWELIDGTAWRLVKLYPGVYRARQRFLDLDEQRALVTACPQGLKQLVRGALATGARFGELAAMKVKNVYLPSSTIMLDTSKNKAKREIPILTEAKEFFKNLLEGKSPEDLLFVKPDGSPWGTNHYVRPLQIAVSEARIEPVIFHELRHTFASTMIMAGVTPAALARSLGHRNERMVLETYGHLKANWATQEVLAKAPRLGIFKGGRKSRRPMI